MNTTPLPMPAVEVRSILAELGWTHAAAGEHLGVGRVTVSRWSSGTRDPGEQVLRHLRMILHLRRLLGDELWQQALADLADSSSGFPRAVGASAR